MSSMFTIEDFGRRLRAGETSAVEMTEQCLRRIATDNDRLNAFILVMADSAREQARNADRELAAGRDRGALHGVPISVKDLFDVTGTATTAGSRVRDGHLASHDAAVVAHLRQAGAVIVGKTCTSSRSGRRTRIRRLVLHVTHTTRRDRQGDRVGDRQPASPRKWRWRPLVQTPADRSAFPPPPAASLD
jgi:hypothetical protein